MAVTRTALANVPVNAILEIISEDTTFDLPSIGAAAKVAVPMLLSTTGVVAVGDYLIPLADPTVVADGEIVVNVQNPVVTVDTVPLMVHNASAGAVDAATAVGFKFLVIKAAGLHARI